MKCRTKNQDIFQYEVFRKMYQNDTTFQNWGRTTIIFTPEVDNEIHFPS